MTHARKTRPEAEDVALPDARNRLLAEKRPSPPDAIDPGSAQIAAKARFEAAVTAVGSGLSDILWRVIWHGRRAGNR